MKVYTRILSQLSKDNPEIQERLEQLTDLHFDCENDNTNSWNFPIICTLLFTLAIFASLYNFIFLLEILGVIGVRLNCDWVPGNLE